MKKTSRFLALLLAAALLAGCRSAPSPAATTMHLKRTEGQVGVSDAAGKDVEPREDLGLYSGYGVETERESYAWIDLDQVKLTKLDEKSEIEITKKDRQLEIEVSSGSLFFLVTEPLESDESLSIRSSTMAVGIRGTCGWVVLEDDDHLVLYLLEGKVRCTAGEESVRVSAGKAARMSTDGQIEVIPFSRSDVPAFVLDELDELDEDLLADLALDEAPPEEDQPDEVPVVLASEPPLGDWELYLPVPDFLDAEQKQLFLHATCAAYNIFGGDPSGVNYFPLADGSEVDWSQIEYETVELDGSLYTLAHGRYRQWDDFQAMMDGLFTPECQQELSGNSFRPTADGRLCYADTLLLDSFYMGIETDTYALVSQTEDELCFDLIRHYADMVYDPETGEDVWEEYAYTGSCPIRMVRTSQGWRVASIYHPTG